MLTKFKNNKFCNNSSIIFIFIIIAFLCTVLLWDTHSLFGPHDLSFHLKRIIELESTWHNFNGFLPSFSFNEFHGAITMLFYPMINLLPFAIFHIFVRSYVSLFYLFIDFNIFISLISCYYGSLKFSHSKLISFVFSFIYSSSFTFLFNAFYNADLGELTAIAVLPLSIFGLINIFNNYNYGEFILGTCLVIYSHVISSLILFMFIFIFLVINMKQINKLKFYKLIKACILIIFLTSIVWVYPFYFEVLNLGNIIPPAVGKLKGVSLFSLLSSSLVGYAKPYLSLFALSAIIFSAFIYKLLNKYEKEFYWISILIILMSSNLMPWRIINKYSIFKVIRILQYTYRIYMIPDLLLSYLFSLCLIKFLQYIDLKKTLLILVIALSLLLQFSGQFWYINNNSPELSKTYVRNITYYKHNNSSAYRHYGPHILTLNGSSLNTTNGGLYKYKVSNNNDIYRLINSFSTDDYYPRQSLPYIDDIDNNKIICDYGTKTYKYSKLINQGYNKFYFKIHKKSSNIDFPLMLYNGENVQIYLNNHIVHFYKNKHNLMSINNVPKGDYELKIKYIANPLLMLLRYLPFVLSMVYIAIRNLLYKLNFGNFKDDKRSVNNV